VTLAEFYVQIEDLIDRLNMAGNREAGTQIETALRGGSTSGEILSDLGVALRRLPQDPPDPQVEAALAFIDETWPT
jgi:hypothetical protein